MNTAVDSSVLFDIVKGAPGAAAAQAALEAALERGGLCVCAVVVAELGRCFADEQNLRDFLAACQIDHDPLTLESALDAARIMRVYARNKGPRERMAPDFLIGAHAIDQPGDQNQKSGRAGGCRGLAKVLEGQDFGAVLVFEDSAERKTNFLLRLPDAVVVASTSELLFGLESRGVIPSAQAILDRAVDVRGNELLVRSVAGSDDSEPLRDGPQTLRPS